MDIKAIKNISLEKLGKKLCRYENQWVAITTKNHIVSSGLTYSETIKKVPIELDVIVLKVPPQGVSFAPLSQSR